MTFNSFLCIKNKKSNQTTHFFKFAQIIFQINKCMHAICGNRAKYNRAKESNHISRVFECVWHCKNTYKIIHFPIISPFLFQKISMERKENAKNVPVPKAIFNKWTIVSKFLPKLKINYKLFISLYVILIRKILSIGYKYYVNG